MTKQEVYNKGYRNGYNAAIYTQISPNENILEAVAESELNARQYSPFEIFASAVNRQSNTEELWDSYENGVNAGIKIGLKDRGVAETEYSGGNNRVCNCIPLKGV